MKLNMENPILQFANTLCSFILLNIIFLITCIPIFTIGVSIVALYTVTMKEAREEHSCFIKTYFRAIKENFRSATIVFLFYFLIGSILFFNMLFWSFYGGLSGAIFLFLVTIAMLILVLSAFYTFPLLARFQNTVKQTILNSYPLAMRHKKITISLILIHTLTISLCILIPQMKLFMILLGFSFIAFCCSFLFIKVFQNYEVETEISN